ncbi:adenosylcobinamide amidohydrolase [Kiloniella laminariae]|uniref:adenosylcobinamide amidohydrolase n=1 Tax=Kiloniella laminariae TaxID=454162 RepID=UPI0003A25845|nr:adenosylcobinamide amidohydrolase [Kiloniella laminariae]
MPTSFTIKQDGPWLEAVFPEPQQMLSWALINGGYASAKEVCWLQVSNADLPPGLDPVELFSRKLEERGVTNAVGLMTSRQVSNYHCSSQKEGSVEVSTLMTLGLSNALSIRGEAADNSTPPTAPGTINLLCHLSVPLSEKALLEASSITTQARTAALLEFNWIAPEQQYPTTGTGTDCIVIACPLQSQARSVISPPANFAGLHTDCGKALGKAVYDVTREAALAWFEQKNIPVTPQKFLPSGTGTAAQTLVSKSPPL